MNELLGLRRWRLLTKIVIRQSDVDDLRSSMARRRAIFERHFNNIQTSRLRELIINYLIQKADSSKSSAVIGSYKCNF
jgi:hypothetical protein